MRFTMDQEKKTINKAQMIEMISQNLADKAKNMSKAKVELVINTFLNSIIAEVAKGNKVSFVGFGHFKSAYHKERVGTNPRTGEKVKVPSCINPAFRFGKDFKTALNK